MDSRIDIKFSEELIKVFDYMGEKSGIIIDWTSENVVPYIYELCEKYIHWEIATSFLWIVFCTIFFIAEWNFYKYIEKKGDSFDDEVGFFFLAIVAIIMSVIAILVFVAQCFDIAKCMFFPELQIYEFIHSIM